VISTTLFSMMIIMALVTTFLTTPLLEWIYPAQAMARDLVESLEASEQRPEPAAPEYRILVCVSHAEAAPRLIAMAGALVRGRERTRIYALHLVPPSDRPSLNLTSGADDAVPRALERAIEAADDLGIDVKPLSFVSPDPADDICRVATVRETDLVLLGCHKPVLGTSALGGVVGEVLRQSPTTVAVLVGGGLRQRGRILVPFQDSPHDRTALVVAGRLAGAADGSVTILRAAPPGRAPDPMGPSLETLQSLVRSGASGYQASAEVPVALEMVRGTSLGEAAAARSADGYEIVVAGVGPDGAPEERGRNPGRLIRDCASSLLLVRGAEAALARAVER
jgi:nucleotide-binding universal stress UspA family protein